MLLKNLLFTLFVITVILANFFSYPSILKAYKLINDTNDLSACRNYGNCIFENWAVKDSDKAFKDLIVIVENTPRLEIIEKDHSYLHAIATSRIMHFIDDIEINNLKEKKILQVKSSSRLGFFDLGVNKRRVQTLHFRLIDIYN